MNSNPASMGDRSVQQAAPAGVAVEPASTGLLDLIRRLREADFRVGTSETLDAARLIKALAEREAGPLDLGQLKAKLRPVLSKTAAQQRQFDAVFQAWVDAQLPSPPHPQDSKSPIADPAAATQPPGPPSTTTTPSRFNGRKWLLYACLGLVIACTALGLWYWRSRTVPVPPPEPVIPAASGVSAPKPAPVSIVPVGSDPPQIYGYFPVLRQQAEVRPIWIWLALAPLFLLLAFAFELGPRLLGGTRVRSGLHSVRLPGWPRQLRAQRTLLQLPAATAGRLARHVHGPADELRRLERRPQLHLKRTVEATVRNLGLPALKFRHARLVPSYLILVEADSDDDHLVLWAERLAQSGVDADLRRIVHRVGEAPRLYRVRRPGNGSDDVGLPLEALPQPSYSQRLVIVSEGAWLRDAQGRPSEAARAGRFDRWRQRVIFTPREPGRWGPHEEAIEQPEHSGDPGFLLLPIDENALGAWSQLLSSGRLPAIELETPQAFPRLIQQLGASAMLVDSPPAGLGDLIAQLKRYLGPNGYFWLACCAVPPLLHPQLTLLLGESFLRGSGASDADLTHYLARSYRLLQRLPWIQQQRMPRGCASPCSPACPSASSRRYAARWNGSSPANGPAALAHCNWRSSRRPNPTALAETRRGPVPVTRSTWAT